MRPFLLAIPLLAAQTAQAADLYVGPAQTYATINSAVGSAQPGDVIWVDPGTYDEWVVVGGGADLTIRANGGVVTWSAPSGNEVLWVDTSTVTLIDIDFDGGLTRRALSATNGSIVTAEDCTFDQGRQTFGGAIYAANATLTVTGGDFTDNVVQYDPYGFASGGAIYAVDSTVEVSAASFTANHALDLWSDGGAIQVTNSGSLTVVDSVFMSNSAGDDGGAINAYLVDVDVDTSLFRLNEAWDGAGINCDSTVVCGVHTSVFDQNVAGDDGGGLQWYYGAGSVDRSLFCDNTANDSGGGDGWGGAIMVYASTATADNNVMANNTALAGGGAGLYFLASLDSVNNTVVGSTATIAGSGFYSGSSSTLTTRNDIVAFGTTPFGGYALFDELSAASIDYALFFGNSDNDYNGLPGTGVQVGVDPLLNGWPATGCSWGDYTLLYGSPAIDTGDPDPLYDDVDGTRSDIGAMGGPDAVWDLFVDYDADGWYDFDDCDDSDPAIHPGADELCDGGYVDEDCDGLIDNQDTNLGDGVPSWPDADGDGAGDYWTPAVDRCDDGTWALNGDDCDDADPYVQDGPLWYEDIDGDGLGDAAVSYAACEQPLGYVDNGDDCDDADPYVGAATPWYPDADGDGTGDAQAYPTYACTQPAGMVADNTDCDDADPNNFPGNTEVCDGLENDCDGLIDTLDPSLDINTAQDWFPDTDGDGYGAGAPVFSCSPPIDHVGNDTDCDDTNAAINPGAFEVCDGVDNNCSGTVDVGAVDASLWFVDADNDGYGDPFTGTNGCTQPPGTVPMDGDCDDTDFNRNPGVTEVCDGIDNDCDSVIDTDAIDVIVWYPDPDGDGYGVEDADALIACYPPAGYTDQIGDCDDSRGDAYPGAPELCNFLDDDCNEFIDDGLPTQPYHPDADGDGFGDGTGEPVDACDAPVGYVDDTTDCDDTDPTTYPGAMEIPGNGIDEDCDGQDLAIDSSRGWDEGDTKPDGADRPLEIGCGCSSGPTAPSLAWLALPLALGLRRRQAGSVREPKSELAE